MSECTWDPRKHGGKPCPVHGAGGGASNGGQKPQHRIRIEGGKHQTKIGDGDWEDVSPEEYNELREGGYQEFDENVDDDFGFDEEPEDEGTGFMEKHSDMFDKNGEWNGLVDGTLIKERLGQGITDEEAEKVASIINEDDYHVSGYRSLQEYLESGDIEDTFEYLKEEGLLESDDEPDDSYDDDDEDEDDEYARESFIRRYGYDQDAEERRIRAEQKPESAKKIDAVMDILDDMAGPGGYEAGIEKLKGMGINVPDEVAYLDMGEDGELVGYNEDGSEELWRQNVNEVGNNGTGSNQPAAENKPAYYGHNPSNHPYDMKTVEEFLKNHPEYQSTGFREFWYDDGDERYPVKTADIYKDGKLSARLEYDYSGKPVNDHDQVRSEINFDEEPASSPNSRTKKLSGIPRDALIYRDENDIDEAFLRREYGVDISHTDSNGYEITGPEDKVRKFWQDHNLGDYGIGFEENGGDLGSNPENNWGYVDIDRNLPDWQQEVQKQNNNFIKFAENYPFKGTESIDEIASIINNQFPAGSGEIGGSPTSAQSKWIAEKVLENHPAFKKPKPTEPTKPAPEENKPQFIRTRDGMYQGDREIADYINNLDEDSAFWLYDALKGYFERKYK